MVFYDDPKAYKITIDFIDEWIKQYELYIKSSKDMIDDVGYPRLKDSYIKVLKSDEQKIKALEHAKNILIKGYKGV